jgi:Uma2 family endonuclease
MKTAVLENIVDENIEAAVAIPAELVYEELNGIPVYYRGYKAVMKGEKQLEEIMGYGGLQWYLLNIIGAFLTQQFGKDYQVLIGEGGLHAGYKKNPSLDLCIYPKAQLKFKDLKNQYLDIPPKIVIEVDTKADPDVFQYSTYYAPKTQLLLDFGVEQVLWIFTDAEKIMVAQPEQPWIIVNWKDEVEVLGHRFSIQGIIDAAEVA